MEYIYVVLAVLACVFLFSFAVFIHEFGHFLAARALGLRVDRFSIGFGPALWRRTIGGVEYRFSAIPFGGYVALPELDPEGTDTLQGGTEKGGELKELPPWKRIVVAFAGPFGNIVLAVVLAFVLSVAPGAHFGETPPVVAFVVPDGEAAKAGLQVGDRVLSVDGVATRAWNDVGTAAALSGGRPVEFKVRRVGQEMALQVKATYSEVLGSYVLDAEPSPRACVGELLPDGAAAKAGVQVDDVIASVDGIPVETVAEVSAVLRRRGSGVAEIGVVRGASNLVLKAELAADPQQACPRLGFRARADQAAAWMPARGAIDQLKWDAGQIFRVLKGLVTPKETKSVARALGGPVMIAQVLYRQVRRNGWDAIGFLRFVDVNLAILNLLPIPVLDGGLILIALLELVFRRKMPKKIGNPVTMAFRWLFLLLMVTLVFRDVARARRISRASDRYDRIQKAHLRHAQAVKDFRPAFDLGN